MYYRLSHDVVTLRCRSRHFDCLLLVFIGRWGRLITRHHYVVQNSKQFVDVGKFKMRNVKLYAQSACSIKKNVIQAEKTPFTWFLANFATASHPSNYMSSKNSFVYFGSVPWFRGFVITSLYEITENSTYLVTSLSLMQFMLQGVATMADMFPWQKWIHSVT